MSHLQAIQGKLNLTQILICATFAKPKKLGFSDFENSKFSRQIVAMRNFFKKRSSLTQIIICANFSQIQKVRLLGFRKFQVFSPNRGDSKLFQKLVKSNLDNDLRKFQPNSKSQVYRISKIPSFLAKSRRCESFSKNGQK